jgi:ribosomal protein S18 acetylase RimI-like enzyme
MVRIEPIEAADFERIMEIDRSEHVTRQYVVVDGRLEVRDVCLEVSRWHRDGSGPHSLTHKKHMWLPILRTGGTLLGADDAGRLVGLALYRPDLTPGTAQLAALYVSRSHRGRGIGRALFEAVAARARDDGAERLYVSSTPTQSTVDFYLARGCRLAAEPHPELLALEPHDVHLVLQL